MFRQLALSAGIVMASSLPALAQDYHAERGTLSVTGHSSVAVENTAAEVTFGVQTRGQTSAEAVERNSALLGAVFAAIKEHGLSEEDMKTSGVTLQQITDRNTQAVTAYEMRNIVDIHIADLSKLGSVLAAAAEAGINRIDNVRMVPANDAVDLDLLRISAAQDARDKAALYADALGLDIIGIRTVGEAGFSRPKPQADYHMARSAMMAVPVAGGTSEADMSVNVIYEVELKK